MAHPHIRSLIGNTPVVDVSALAPHPGVRLLVKLESLNPFGSLKDRVAAAMLDRATATGKLAPGQPILAPSSGNTGISLAALGGLAGQPVTVVMPADASPERRRALAAFGAEVILTPAALASPGAIRRAEELAAEHPEWCLLNQYDDDANPQAHRETTGPELCRDVPDITHFVSGIGSGGTIAGVGRFLAERNHPVAIIAAEPRCGPRIEGVRALAAGYVPPVYDRWQGRTFVADTRAVEHERSLRMTSLLARECGVFAGPSSGMALAAAIDIATATDRGTIVFLACDGGWKYLSDAVRNEPAAGATSRRRQSGASP